MAKRKGVNMRKKYAQRKRTVASGLRRAAPLVGGGIAVLVAIIVAIYGGVLSFGKISAAIERSTLFAVKSVTVSGNEHLKTSDVVTLSGVRQLSKLYGIQTSDVASSLLADPWIEKARCVKKWWGTVAIEITERTPVALISTPEVRLVDRHGILLSVEPGTTYDLPLISKARFTRDRRGNRCVDSGSIARAARFIASVHSLSGTPMAAISQLDISDTCSVRCRVASSPAVIDIGYDADDKQLRNLRYLLMALVEIPSSAARIDLRYENLAFVSENAQQQPLRRDAVN